MVDGLYTLSTEEQFKLNWHTYSDHLKEMMQNLMQADKSADVTLVCEDKTRFKAHQFVLNACSPVIQSITDILTQSENPVLYMRGIFAPEMKSILQFMYLGQATFYRDRMKDFLNVAKSLEIKELSNDVESEDPLQTQEHQERNPSNLKIANAVESSKLNKKGVKEEEKVTDTKISRCQNEGCVQFICDKCNKQFAGKSGLWHHKQSVHEGIKYKCSKCSKAYNTNHDLGKHVQSIHEGVQFPCDLCDSVYTRVNHLRIHKKQKH